MSKNDGRGGIQSLAANARFFKRARYPLRQSETTFPLSHETDFTGTIIVTVTFLNLKVFAGYKVIHYNVQS